MKHAINLPNMAEPAVLVELATTAEAHGWDGVFLWDHLTHPGDAPPTVDPWVVLGAMAQATDRVRLGTMVTPLSRRRPQKVAKELSTLDALSGGRAVLGVGLGVPVDTDFAAFGEVTDDRERARLLDAHLDHIAGALGAERPPVWVAGHWPNRRPFERAARWDGVAPLLTAGDGITLCRPDDVREIVDFVRTRRSSDDPFDVVVTAHWEHTAAEYEDAGVTWLVQSWDAEPGWPDMLRDVITSVRS